MRAYVQGETDEWEPEMHLERTSNRKCLERERVERCMGTGFLSFADEDEEEPFNLAGIQWNEALASEKNEKNSCTSESNKSCMISRVVVAVIVLKVQTRKAQAQDRAKLGGQRTNRKSRDRLP